MSRPITGGILYLFKRRLPFMKRWMAVVIGAIITVALAIYGIVYFLNIGRCTQVGSFVADLDDSVKQVWKISAPKTYLFKDHSLPTAIEYICFADFSKPVTGNEEIYNAIRRYEESGTLFFYPANKACDFPYYKLEHINITAITSTSNPYCIKNNGKPQLELSKGYYENLVKIK